MLLTRDFHLDFLEKAPRFLFFTGKGGVGKTSLSSATAILMADQGKRILLVSTDPASNLDQVLGTTLGAQPTPIPDAPGLFALNIDPRKAASDYRERVVAPYRGVLPDAAIAGMEEQLSGACTVEIAAFDEFSKLLTDEEATSQFDYIIFDTAPTGHTLRLLRLPAAWDGYLSTNSGDSSCLSPMSGLKSHKEQFEATIATLTDSALTLLVLVCRPDKHSISEAARTSIELLDVGLANQWLAVNGILKTDSDVEDDVAIEMKLRERNALEAIPESMKTLPMSENPLFPGSLIGVPALRNFVRPVQEFRIEPPSRTDASIPEGALDISELIKELSATSGLIMTMGKGGVGKTTIATLVAVRLASEYGLKVHLTTSDPAAHIDADLGSRFPNIHVSRIDPVEETNKYRSDVMDHAGASLDEEGRRLLEEDLLSPCTEEVAVFRAFARVVEEAGDSIVVLDTAPTGHTLLLLDATESYHREVMRKSGPSPEEVKNLLPRLRDPNYTKILIVTLPEATPVQEAIALQADLKRAEITPYAWIVNQSLTPLEIRNPLLASRRSREMEYIRQVSLTAAKTIIVPWDANALSNVIQ